MAGQLQGLAHIRTSFESARPIFDAPSAPEPVALPSDWQRIVVRDVSFRLGRWWLAASIAALLLVLTSAMGFEWHEGDPGTARVRFMTYNIKAYKARWRPGGRRSGGPWASLARVRPRSPGCRSSSGGPRRRTTAPRPGPCRIPRPMRRQARPQDHGQRRRPHPHQDRLDPRRQ